MKPPKLGFTTKTIENAGTFPPGTGDISGKDGRYGFSKSWSWTQSLPFNEGGLDLLVPDTPWFAFLWDVSFTQPCNNHDLCYGSCGELEKSNTSFSL